MRGIALVSAATFVVLLHAVLLWRRLTDLSLLEPAVLSRWLASASVLVAIVLARRAGIPLLVGGRAPVFWLAVLLIHLPAPAAAELPGAALGLPPVLPVATALASAMAIVLPLVAALVGRSMPAAPLPGRPTKRPAGRLRLPLPCQPSLYSRPPPIEPQTA